MRHRNSELINCLSELEAHEVFSHQCRYYQPLLEIHRFLHLGSQSGEGSGGSRFMSEFPMWIRNSSDVWSHQAPHWRCQWQVVVTDIHSASSPFEVTHSQANTALETSHPGPAHWVLQILKFYLPMEMWKSSPQSRPRDLSLESAQRTPPQGGQMLVENRVKLFIISMIFDKFVQLLSHSMTTVTWKIVTESSVFHGESWFQLS